MKKSLLMLTVILTMFIVCAQAQVTALYESFEGGIPSNWTVLDADNDGATWRGASDADWSFGLYEGYTGDGYAISFDASSSDNWLITPSITLGSNATLTFYRFVLWNNYAEHYGVYISTTTTDPSAFALLQEETGVQADYSWRQRTINLSTYEGQTVYIAFRHFNSSAPNRFLALDDITVTMSTVSSMIVTNPSELNFGTVPAGSPSPSQQVSITAYNVTDGVTVSVNSPFEVSVNHNTYSNSVTLPDTGGSVYVRYNPIEANADNSNLTVTGGTATRTVALSGVSLDCSDITLPYTQNFDNTAPYTMPDCWYQINPYDGSPGAWSYHARSGLSLMLVSDENSSEPVFAVMPKMPQALSDLQITFWASCAGLLYTPPLYMGYMTDPSDGSTFVPLWSKTTAEMGDVEYHSFIVNFSDVSISSDSNYYIAFRYQTNSGWTWHLDDIIVEAIPSCGAPTDLTVSQVTSSSANISWGGETESYMVFYRPVGETVWDTIPHVALDSAGFMLSDLLPITRYEWYVASDCEDGTFVNSLETSFFKTECAIYTVPFTENFNASNSIPECWEKMEGFANDAFDGTNPTHAIATSGWEISNMLFDNNHLVFNILGSNTNSWVVTPSINLSSVENPALVFDLALTAHNSTNPIGNTTTPTDDKFMVLVSTDDGMTWSAENAVVWSDEPESGDYAFSQIATLGQEVIIPLDAYIDQTVKIAFYGESTVSNGSNDLHVDNVMVIETPACARPMDLMVDQVTYNSAVVFWSNDEIVDSCLFEYRSENDTVWHTQVVTDTIVYLTDLDDYTDYEVRVSNSCGNNEYSQPAELLFTTDMEAQTLPFSTDFSENDGRKWVYNNGSCKNYWIIGSLGDESALFVTNNGITAGYNSNNFSIVSVEKPFVVGVEEDVVISFDARVGGDENFDYLKVFFAPADASYPSSNTFVSYAEYDYNVNAVRFPSILSLYPYILNLTNDSTVHIEVTMPNPNTNPTDSSIAKLVFLWKNDQSAGTPPGAIITNVSVYPVACPRPTNLTFSNVTTHSAVVSWTPSGLEAGWILEYKADSDAGWTSMPLSTNMYTFNDLTLGTNYQVRVQADCEEEQSLWLEGSFMTFCDAVTLFPYTEGFENNGEMADCWMQEYVIDELNWAIHTGNDGTINTAHEGSYNAYFYSTDGYFTTKLVSPIFDLTGVDNPYMTYWYTHAAFVNNLDVLKIYYRTSPSAVWQLLSTHELSVAQWTMDSLMLPTPSATYQIAFEGRVNAGHGITLDDITIASSGPSPVVDTCDTPTGLAVVDAMMYDESYSLTLEWDNNPDVSLWNVQYRKDNESWTVVSVSENSYQMENLLYEKNYCMRVQAVCDEDNSSAWTNQVCYSLTAPGIDDYLQNSINLYPNPANDVVNVQCTMSNVQWKGATIEVLDVYGKLLQTFKSDAEITQINVNNLANGVYFVRVTMDEGVVTKKFVRK